jgi:hypothetical protein
VKQHLHFEAKPIALAGRFRLDPAKLSARHDGQVQAALKGGPFALLILGGAHDLTDSPQRAYGGNCEYMRIMTARYREVCRGSVREGRMFPKSSRIVPGNPANTRKFPHFSHVLASSGFFG